MKEYLQFLLAVLMSAAFTAILMAIAYSAAHLAHYLQQIQ